MKQPLATITGGNLLLMLLAAVVAYSQNARPSDAALMLFVALVPLWLLNGVALFVALFLLPRSKPYFLAFLLSTILIIVIGLGVCGLAVANLNVH